MLSRTPPPLIDPDDPARPRNILGNSDVVVLDNIFYDHLLEVLRGGHTDEGVFTHCVGRVLGHTDATGHCK